MRQQICAITLASILTGAIPALAADSATPEEVIAKVWAAAEYLAKEGKSGLATFDKADSEFVWKDSYVFVYNCADDVIAAHPVAESRGGTISALRGGDGGAFGVALCAAAEKPGGSWTEYQWRHPVEATTPNDLAYSGDYVRKVSYALSVVGAPYQVGAGIFNDSMSLEILNEMIQ
jgi:signal transduction histidine kinase